MPLFTYNRNIPDGPNNPSADQPRMQTNTNSTDDLIDVDHYSFNDGNGGLHRQINLVNEASPGILGNSVIYGALNNGRSVPWIKNSIFDGPMISGAGNGAVASGTGFGYSSTFGGTIIQWGFVNPPTPPYFTNANIGIVSFATVSGSENINFPNSCSGVWTSLCWDFTNDNPPFNPASIAIDTSSLNPTGFRWVFNGTPSVLGNTGIIRFFYVAIGF